MRFCAISIILIHLLLLQLVYCVPQPGCSQSQCKDSNADCHLVDRRPCCVCKRGYFGGRPGARKCESIAKPTMPFFKDGDATFKFKNGKSFTLAVATRKSITHGKYRPAEAYFRGTIPDYAKNFLSLMSPALHILASFDAVPTQIESRLPIFNIISLTEHYKNGFRSNFTIKVGAIGKINVVVTTSNIQAETQPKAKLAMKVNADFDPKLITCFLADEEINIAATKPMVYLAYHKGENNTGITFVPFQRTFVPEVKHTCSSMQRLELNITGHGDYNQGCMLHKDSWVGTKDIVQVVLGEGTYCNLEPATFGIARFLCVDMQDLRIKTDKF